MQSTHRQVVANLKDGLGPMDFFSTILAGFLLGLGLDAWLGTRPWFIIGGIVLGTFWGFLKLKRMSDAEVSRLEERYGRR